MLVDDSIVRGTTSKQIIDMAREAGAKKVYMASAAPPVKYPNVYGIDMPASNEFAADGRTEEEISLLIGADKLIYQDLIDLISSVKDKDSSIIGIAERKILEVLRANCNSPIGVHAFFEDKNYLTIKVELFSHNGQEKYIAEASGKFDDSIKTASEVGNIIIKKVGQKYINELDNLKDDFNYTP